MAKYNQGIFIPSNPMKYCGKGQITYRSSWELTLMNVFDQHPNIIKWSSESIEIPYTDPFSPLGKQRTYIPDFFIVYLDISGTQHTEIIEVKPMSQTLPEAAKSMKDKEAVVLNDAKWQAAYKFCQQQGITFRIMTENQIYRQASGK